MSLLKLSQVSKTFQSGSKRLHVLRQIDLELAEGELLAIVGQSGSGKTTLLNCIAGLDRVDSGSIVLDGRELTSLAPDDWDEIRRDAIGFVFQFNNLLPEFSAEENVLMPGLLRQGDRKVLRERARELLSLMGIADRASHLPTQLSGGEQQRVAIARALINTPQLLLADEPTGSLDPESGMKVFDLLKALQKDLKISCLVVTHNPALADLCARIHRLERTASAADPQRPETGASYV